MRGSLPAHIGRGLLFAGILVAGCANEAKPSHEHAPVAQTPVAQAPLEGATFGAAIDTTTAFVALAEILADPKAYAGRRVRTRGEVVAVCQRAGCWADLRPEGASASKVPTHVSMHDHAFFLPKNAKKKVAEIEGTLAVRELSQAECDHYNGEGASLVPGTPVLGVDARGVILR